MTTVTKKIDTLTAATTVANNDKLVILDVSEAAVDMTKLATMSQIPISLASQLSTDVVENSKIKDGAVTTTKILDGNVTYAKIQKSQNAFVLGNKASTTGAADAIVEIQPSAASQVLLGSTGTTNTVDFGKVTKSQISMAANSVLVNATGATASPTEVATTTSGHVLRHNGTAIGWGTLTGASIANDAIDSQHYAADSIDAEHYAPDSVDYLALKKTAGAEAVTTATIRDGAVTNSKLGADAVDGAKIADESINSEHYIDGSIDAVHLAAMTSAQLAGIISDETGTGKLVFGTSPTLITPVLGTPASGTLTNCTGLPASGIATMTSADLAGRVSDETGTGKLVFATSPTLVTPTLNSPTLVTPALGTPASGTLTNCTGLPASGIATMTSADLADRVSDETGTGKLVFATSPTLTSPTLVTPALGTPASGTLTNCTGLTGSGIINDAIDSQHYAADSIDAEHYAPDSVDYLALKKTAGAEAVTTATIRDGAVTNSKLGADAVDGAKIADNAIGNEHIRDSAALSVIGRSSSTSGNPADIVAGTNGHVLRLSGTTLGFGTVATAGIADGAVTAEKIADNAIGNEHIRDSAALSVIGRSSSTSGNPADIVAGTNGHVLRLSGTTLGFGTVATAGIADGAVTETKLGTGAVTPTKTNFFTGAGIYFGAVAANGTALSLPSGWTSSRGTTGHYTVTHPSFALNFPVVSAQHMSTVNAVATSFDVNIMNAVEFKDAAFWFILIVG